MLQQPRSKFSGLPLSDQGQRGTALNEHFILVGGEMDIGAAIADMWRTVIVFVPKAVAFIAILIIGWVIAGFLRKWVDRLLERVGFDRAVERGGLRRWL